MLFAIAATGLGVFAVFGFFFFIYLEIYNWMTGKSLSVHGPWPATLVPLLAFIFSMMGAGVAIVCSIIILAQELA